MHAAPRDSEHDTLKCTSRHDTSTVSAFVETLSAFMNMRTRIIRANHDALRHTLESLGVEFLEDDGVKRRGS